MRKQNRVQQKNGLSLVWRLCLVLSVEKCQFLMHAAASHVIRMIVLLKYAWRILCGFRHTQGLWKRVLLTMAKLAQSFDPLPGALRKPKLLPLERSKSINKAKEWFKLWTSRTTSLKSTVCLLALHTLVNSQSAFWTSRIHQCPNLGTPKLSSWKIRMF